MANEIRFNSGYNNCDDRIAIVKNEVVPRDLDSFEDLDASKISEKTYLYVDNNGEHNKVSLKDVQEGMSRVQSDFSVTDEEDPAYIRHQELQDVVLTEPLTSLYAIGGIKANTTFPVGTSLKTIFKAMFSSIDDATIYFDVFNSLPTSILDFNDSAKISTTKNELLVNGLTERRTYNNQYYVLVIPHSYHIVVDTVLQAGWPTSFKVNNEFNSGSCAMYYYELPITGTYDIKYTFKETN